MRFIPLQKDRVKDLVSLWNTEIGRQFPMREELFIQNSIDDQNVLVSGSWIAVDEENQVIGFVVSKIWQENMDIPMKRDIGWIQALLVKSSYRKQGIGNALLKKAESALMEHYVTTIHLGRDPFHYFPGIPNEDQATKLWFTNRGYVGIGIETDLINHYSDISASSYLVDGVECSLLQKDEQEEFLSFLKRSFSGRWEYEATIYFQNGGTGREFVVMKKGGRIIGFCRVNDHASPLIAPNTYWAPLFKEPLGGVGPLGIGQNERKNGYGLAIVEAGISFLRKRQINHIAIDWTGLVDFYGKLGFTTWKEYEQFSKKIQPFLKIEN